MGDNSTAVIVCALSQDRSLSRLPLGCGGGHVNERGNGSGPECVAQIKDGHGSRPESRTLKSPGHGLEIVTPHANSKTVSVDRGRRIIVGIILDPRSCVTWIRIWPYNRMRA